MYRISGFAKGRTRVATAIFALTIVSLAALAIAAIVIAGTPGSVGDTIADFLLGQSSFTAIRVSFDARGVAVDSSGHVYVADNDNNRVFGWTSADAMNIGKPPDLVIGQPDFISNSCNQGGNPSATTLCEPTGVGVDGARNLYVSDSGNSRVLEYATPFAACTSLPCVGGSAAVVFGQDGSFTSGGVFGCNQGGVGPDTLCIPEGVALDSSGNLYVADFSNNRVLEYNTPLANPLLPNTTADVVFGQPNFTFRSCNDGTAKGDVLGLGPDSLCNPEGVALDSSGNLYVADFDNSRVLEYNTPLTTDTTADVVFGQNGSFTTAGCNHVGVGPDSLCFPFGVALDSTGNLYVTDTQNNRVLEYNMPLANPSSPNITANVVFGQGGSFTSNQFNDGIAAGDVSGLGPDSLFLPSGVALDSSGNLYVADTGDGRALIYEQPLSTAPSATPTPTATATATGSATPTATSSATATNTPTSTATTTATRTATATATSTGSATPTATATATATPVPVKLRISKTLLNFGTVNVGTPKGPKNVIVRNPTGGIGNKLHLTVLMEGISGGISPFSAANGCTAPLAPGAKCTIGVTFKPTAKGLQKTTLTIFDDAQREPQRVKLKGIGK